MNKLYIRDRITKFEIWCPIDSIYDAIIWGDTGVMQADTPWSGHYTVWPSVWTVAHTTQFAAPGWKYMDGACGQFDPQTWRGSHVALRDPKTGDWSLIIVTGGGRKVRVEVGSGLAAGPLHLWKSTSTEQFIEQPRPQLNDRAVELDLGPNSVYTLTTTTGQQKGSFGKIPAAKPFPFPFQETFESYEPGVTPQVLLGPERHFRGCSVTLAAGCVWHRLFPNRAFFGATTSCPSRTRSTAIRPGAIMPPRPMCFWPVETSRLAGVTPTGISWDTV